ncbi:TPA: ATP-binding protein [Enterobacter cloacae]|uniref:ATP-binding protein n=1 Tax=Enterobacter cloacae complex sp. P31C TaxID=2779560 RepID=UPI001D01F270|nr:ATP-binding protein [Enterobacter cloacae complex sp. P31C]
MQMKLSFSVIMMIVFFFGPVSDSLSAQKVQFTPEEMAYIKKHPVIKYGIFPKFYPIETINELGEHIGLTRDYISLICDATGMRFELVPSTSGNESFKNLKEGKVSLLTSTSASFAEQNGLARSVPVYSTWPVTVTRKATRHVTTPDDIQEGMVSITDYLSLIQWFTEKYPQVDFTVSSSPEKTIDNLIRGNSVAAVVLSPTAFYYMNMVYPDQLKISRPYTEKIPLVMSANPEDRVLIEIINKVLNSLTPTQHGNLIKKWIVSGDNKPNYTGLSAGIYLALSGFLLLLLILTLCYHWKTRKKLLRQHTQRNLELSVISHELRTPLIGILTATEGLLSSPLSLNHKDRLLNIINVTRAMLENLDLSLDYARISSGAVRLNPQPHLLSSLCDTSIKLFIEFAETHGTTLQVRYLSDKAFQPHLVDGVLLSQAINNVVSNAIKYTSGGLVLMECSQVQVDGKSMFCIEIIDTGTGIPEKALRRLAEPFVQFDEDAPGPHERPKGSGLGLFVSKQNMQLLGGHLVLNSKPGVGSRVKLVFPVIPGHLQTEKFLPAHIQLRLNCTDSVPVSELISALENCHISYHIAECPSTTKPEYDPTLLISFERQKKQWLLYNNNKECIALNCPLYASDVYSAVVELCCHRSEAGSCSELGPSVEDICVSPAISRRVLLIDDEPLLLEVQQELFIGMGYTVDAVCEAQQAYQCWLQHRHEIIITDCRLDESDGFELVRHLRILMQNTSSDVLIIGQSAALRDDDTRLAREVGMDFLLQKPIAGEQWQQLIQDYFSDKDRNIV